MQTKIQTLHPIDGKKNQSVDLEKYQLLKAAILKITKDKEPTHTELLNELQKKLKNKFDGNINWFAMVVKLDLEAKKMIKRTSSKPQKYRIE